MKKSIIAGLLLMSLVGFVFAQTGEVFTKIKGGTVDVGSTGFKVNYDAFGLEYKFVSKSSVLDVDTYSPGYINITGFKAGMLTLGAGLTLKYGYDNYAVTKDSNGLVTALSDGGNTKTAYAVSVLPRIALNVGTMNVTTSDQSEIYFAESIQKTYVISNAGTNIVENPDAAIYKRELRTKVGANMKGLWNGELGGYANPHWYWMQQLGSYTENFDFEWNSWGDWGMALNPAMDLYVKGWFKYTMYNNKSKVVNAGGITNISGTRGSEAYFGPEARVQYKIAGGQVKLNLGIGLASKLWSDSYNYSEMINSVATNVETTNAVESWYTLYGVKRDDNRALLQFGGSTKFGDWEFGMDSRLDFTIALYKETKDPVSKSVTSHWLNDTAPWSEPLFIPIVKTIYLKYSKQMFSVQFDLINPDQERGAYEDTGVGFGTDATKRWFYSVSFNYKF